MSFTLFQSCRLRAALALCGAAVPALLSGCGGVVGGGGGGGTAALLNQMRNLEDQCHGGAVDSYVAIDASRSGDDADLRASRIEVARQAAMVSATCSGQVRIVAFSAVTSDTRPLVTLNFSASKGTENSRRIRAGRALNEALSNVSDGLDSAADKLNTGQTDVLPQLILAHQFQRKGTRLSVVVASDGIQTAPGPGRMVPGPFTMADARHAADLVNVPRFSSEATVKFVGIGRLAAGRRQPPSEFTRAITAFYERACARTGATCAVTSNDQ